MSDLISRADAIKAVSEAVAYGEGFIDVLKALESLPSADAVPQLKQADTLIIADALRYLAQDTERHLSDRTRADALREQILQYGASMCHSADAVQGEWIPCSERLPEEFYVLCCDSHGGMLIANPFECDDSDTGFSAESDECYMYNCIAWMPLPKPYKGGARMENTK